MQTGHSFASCKAVFYGVKYIHKLYRLPDPTIRSLPTNMLEAIKRLDVHHVNRKEPLTPVIFRKLHYELTMRSGSLEDVRTMVFVVLGFCGFLRYNEIVNVRKGDIVLEEGFVRVFVEKSKTDIYRDGRWVYIATGISTCPVGVITYYLRKCGSDLKKDSFLFRAVVKTKKRQYLRRTNKHLCYSTMRGHFLKALRRVGEDATEFGTHSLRSGGASSAANSGVSDRLFKRHGRWKSDRAKDGYVKDDIKRLLSVTKSLVFVGVFFRSHGRLY